MTGFILFWYVVFLPQILSIHFFKILVLGANEAYGVISAWQTLAVRLRPLGTLATDKLERQTGDVYELDT